MGVASPGQRVGEWADRQPARPPARSLAGALAATKRTSLASWLARALVIAGERAGHFNRIEREGRARSLLANKDNFSASKRPNRSER